MKKILILRFPWLYFPARALWRLTPFHWAREARRRRQHAERSAQTRKRNHEILGSVFGGNTEVRDGPFAGMKYVENASGSTLLPKIAGCYEAPIRDWVEEVIAGRRYDKILVIGSAEGYYAVGFAVRLPEARIIAYDIDAGARELCRRMAALNGAANVDVRESCDWAELDAEIGERTLVFCDIEGAERELLDPRRVRGLARADLIIESHDSYLPGMTELLTERFENSHEIDVAVDDPAARPAVALPVNVAPEVLAAITDEHRAPMMKFIFCRRRKSTLPQSG